jgi:hypothetical protein
VTKTGKRITKVADDMGSTRHAGQLGSQARQAWTAPGGGHTDEEANEFRSPDAKAVADALTDVGVPVATPWQYFQRLGGASGEGRRTARISVTTLACEARSRQALACLSCRRPCWS